MTMMVFSSTISGILHRPSDATAHNVDLGGHSQGEPAQKEKDNAPELYRSDASNLTITSEDCEDNTALNSDIELEELQMSAAIEAEAEVAAAAAAAGATTDLEAPSQQDPDKGRGDNLWPFLLRFPITIFGAPMGVGSHAIMWRMLASISSMHYLHIPHTIGIIWWILCLIIVVVASTLYILKLIFWPKAVYLELRHPVRSNYFVTPFIVGLILVLGVPSFLIGVGDGPSHLAKVHVYEPFIFSAPLFTFEIYIYGHWFFSKGGKLSEIGNPTTQLAVVGNFMSAIAFALASWKEIALFFVSVGFLQQLVVFISIYLRTTSEIVIVPPLRPSYFLCIAPPSIAAIAWTTINDNKVDNLSTIFTFMAAFIYIIMISRIKVLLSGVRFSLSWWAFVFPTAALTMAMMTYSNGREGLSYHWIPETISLCLGIVSTSALIGVLTMTIFEITVGRLFVNDSVVMSAIPPQIFLST